MHCILSSTVSAYRWIKEQLKKSRKVMFFLEAECVLCMLRVLSISQQWDRTDLPPLSGRGYEESSNPALPPATPPRAHIYHCLWQNIGLSRQMKKGDKWRKEPILSVSIGPQGFVFNISPLGSRPALENSPNSQGQLKATLKLPKFKDFSWFP
jgi:hypothetical protein